MRTAERMGGMDGFSSFTHSDELVLHYAGPHCICSAISQLLCQEPLKISAGLGTD